MTRDEHPGELLNRSFEGLPDGAGSLELLARAQQGDESALSDLVERYQTRIRRIVRIQLGGSALRRDFDSMDFVQGTFRAALPRIGELRPRSPSSLLQWLALIAANQIRDAYDWQHADKRDVAREVEIGTQVQGRLQTSAPSPDEQALLKEVRELLDDEVARLPDDQRRVVVLRDYCGEEWDRIASELNRQPGAARQLHQRAWISLRRTLGPKLTSQ